MKNTDLDRTLQRAYALTDNSGLRRTRESLSRLKMKLASWKGPSDTECGYQKMMISDGVEAARAAYKDDIGEIEGKINRTTTAFLRANLSEPGFSTLGGQVVVQFEKIRKRNFYVTVNNENTAIAIFHMSPKHQENVASLMSFAPSSAVALGTFIYGQYKQMNESANILITVAAGAATFVAIKLMIAIRDLNKFTPNRFIERMKKMGDVVESALEMVEEEMRKEAPSDGAK